ILHFEGSLDGQTETLAVERAREVMDSGGRFLVIDLKGVDMVTSAGLRALHTIYKMFTPNEEIQAWHVEHADETFKSPYFVLAQPSPQVHYVLSIAGFLQSICIFPTMQAALDSFPPQ
ncbi:MAG: STAS domain-containing protein, partial [Legionella sp.]|nr:STAS domain-containing protein [Legionella sp.]